MSNTAAPAGKLVVALDVATLDEAVALAGQFTGLPVWMKVGLELFTAAGTDSVEKIREMGFPVFLDLKFHDIPNTVGKAVESAGRLGVGIVTLHAGGGKAMLEAARQAGDRLQGRGIVPPLMLGVTVLTSQHPQELGLDEEGLRNLVLERAVLVRQAGLDGVVCSGHEAAAIKEHCGQDCICLCPGIRFAGASDCHDQARVMTPDAAVAAGADFIVMGRPLRESPEPARAALEALKLMGYQGNLGASGNPGNQGYEAR